MVISNRVLGHVTIIFTEQVYKATEGQDYWLRILDWMERMSNLPSCAVYKHPDFQWVDTQLHDLLSGEHSSPSQVRSDLLFADPVRFEGHFSAC